MFPGLDLYYSGSAQPLTATGDELLIDDLDHDPSDLSGVKRATSTPARLY